MSEKLNTIVGKQNDFATRLMGGGSRPALSSGALLTLTPPRGQRVRLTHLSTQSGAVQANISITIGGVTIFSGVAIEGDNPDAQVSKLTIGSFQDYPVGFPPSGNHAWFTGGRDEVLIINKGTTAQNAILYYGYQFGE